MSRMLPQQTPTTVDALIPGPLTGDGRAPSTPRPGIPAAVEGGVFKVRDERPKSDTVGQEIAASVHVVMHPEDYVPVGARLTVQAGTPAARTVEVVRAILANDPAAPESSQAWGV